jgi:hypothetical protein
MSRAIPVADLARLDGARRRTTAVRWTLIGAVIVCLGLIAAASARPSGRELAFAPHGANGIVVLDLSASISSDTFQRIGTTLRDFAATNGHYGLVAFSDVAYSALPPGTPAAELRPYARYFTLPPAGNSGFLPQFPTNPWTNSFSSGTRISAGLGLALKTIRQQHLGRPAVILVSDLDDDPGDIQNLGGIALAYKKLRIPVRIVALSAQPGDEALFARLLAGAVHITDARLPQTPPQRTGGGAPLVLVLLAVLLALALAASELWSAQLVWGEPA